MSILCIYTPFRYLPKNPHPMTVYVRPGVEVDKKRSNEKRVTLKNLVHSTTGRYRCEVSTEGPTFATESKFGDLMVVGKHFVSLFVVLACQPITVFSFVLSHIAPIQFSFIWFRTVLSLFITNKRIWAPKFSIWDKILRGVNV